MPDFFDEDAYPLVTPDKDDVLGNVLTGGVCCTTTPEKIVTAAEDKVKEFAEEAMDDNEAVITVTDGTIVTFNLTLGKYQQVTLGGNRTLALANSNNKRSFVLALIQDGTGNRTVTWFSGIKWGTGGLPTLATGVGKKDLFVFIQLTNGEFLGAPYGSGNF